MEFGKTRNHFSVIMHPKKNIKLKKYYTETFSETTGREIQSLDWGGNRQFSMEGVAVEYFQFQLILVAIKNI